MSSYTCTATYPWKDELERYRTLAAGLVPHRQMAGTRNASWRSSNKLFALTRNIRIPMVQLSIRTQAWNGTTPLQPTLWQPQYWWMQGTASCWIPHRLLCHIVLMPW